MCDRGFVAVDPTGRFITGRKYPKMVLIEVTVSPEGKKCGISGPGMADLTVDLPDWEKEKKLDTAVRNSKICH